RLAVFVALLPIVIGGVCLEALPVAGVVLCGLAVAGSPECLALLAGYDARVGTAQALELQVLPDGVVEQTHAPPNHTRLAVDACMLAGPWLSAWGSEEHQ